MHDVLDTPVYYANFLSVRVGRKYPDNVEYFFTYVFDNNYALCEKCFQTLRLRKVTPGDVFHMIFPWSVSWLHEITLLSLFNGGSGYCVIMTTKREFRAIYFPKRKTNAREYLPMFYKAITICHTIIDLWGTVRKSWPQSNCTQTPSPSKLHQPQG